MKRAMTVFLLGAVTSACDKKSDPAPAQAVPQGSASAARPSAIPPYHSDAGRFTAKVTFGTVIEKDMRDPQGLVWKTAEWKQSNAMYSVQYAELPSLERVLAEMKVFKATRDPSQVVLDKETTFEGRPSRDYEVKLDALTGVFRFVADGTRLYKIVGMTKGDRALATAFVDGITLDGAAPAPAAAATDSPDMAAGRNAVALYKRAIELAEAAGGNCATFGRSLEPVRKELWDLGGAHPALFRKLSNAELRTLRAVDTQKELSTHLMACKDTAAAKELTFAIGRLIDAAPAAAPAKSSRPAKPSGLKKPKRPAIDDPGF